MLRLYDFEILLLEWREEVGNVMFVSYFLFWFQI